MKKFFITSSAFKADAVPACYSNTNRIVTLSAASLFQQSDYLFVVMLFGISGGGSAAYGFRFRVCACVEQYLDDLKLACQRGSHPPSVIAVRLRINAVA